jgi:YVTN family beta-propeller protein
MKFIPVLSNAKSNNTQHASMIISVLVLFSCMIITPLQLQGQLVSNQFFNSEYVLDEKKPEHRISLFVPSNWTVTKGNNTINFSPPLERGSDLFSERLVVKVLGSGNIPLNEYVSLGIIELRRSLENFTLTYSDANFIVTNHPAFKIIYTYTNNTADYEAMRIWVVVGRNTYTISYHAESNKFHSYLPVVENMVDSLRVELPENTNEPVKDTAGLRLRDSPYSIGIDAYRNRIYTANSRSGSVSVIDGQNDKILADIKVDLFPSAIDVNPETDRLLVVNRDSDSVSVIDGSTNAVIGNISVGDRPIDIAIDPNEEGSKSLLFVSNSASDSVSVIDGSTNAVIGTLDVREEPGDLALNSITNRLYVTNYLNNSVSVIDYYVSNNEELRNETIANIQVGDQPVSIDFNQITNRLYVSNSASDSVSVIDGSTNAVIDDILVGTNPYGVAINTDRNLIYVANYLSNSVSVIDGSTNAVIDDSISVSEFPFLVSYNPINKIAYVTHLPQNVVSMINGTVPVIGITFEIDPAESGYIICNEREFFNGDYVRYNISTPLDCRAVPNEGFSFSSWSGDLTSKPIPLSQTTFDVSKSGNVTANFVVPVEFTLPKEYWDQLTVILIGVIVPAIAGWSIPAIAGWLNGRRQRRHLRKFMISIDVRNKISSQEPVKYLSRFEDIRRDIDEALAAGDINESQFDILNNKILEYLKPSKQ